MLRTPRRYCVGILSVLRRWGVGLLAASLPLAAGAEEVPPWEGYWSANAAWCARAGDVGDESPDWYGRDGFFGIEWSCDLDRITETALPNSWVVEATCLDAGEPYRLTQIFLLTYEDRLLMLDETGVAANMVRCRKVKP